MQDPYALSLIIDADHTGISVYMLKWCPHSVEIAAGRGKAKLAGAMDTCTLAAG